MFKKIKLRILGIVLAMTSIFTFVLPLNSYAVNYFDGGWSMMHSTSAVVDDNGNHVGTVYAGEGVTVLFFSGNRAYIEYSASGAPKRGYVNYSSLLYTNTKFPGSCVGEITANSNTYYAPNTSLRAGSVNAGETVSVLARTGYWAYVEYNTSNAMRKRAFMPASNIVFYNANSLSGLYQNNGGSNYPVSSNITVYSGPSNKYPTIGTIFASDNGQVRSYGNFMGDNGRTMLFVSYPASGSTKYGYIYA